MTRWQQTAPSLADFEEMALRTRAALPAEIAAHCGTLRVRVADFAPREVLASLGMSDPYELTGLYEGAPEPVRAVSDLPELPSTVWLYRRPILDEWAARGDVTLDHLVRHVIVHEIAHHFGFTDEEIAAIDDWRL